jgi:hypothetical protein
MRFEKRFQVGTAEPHKCASACAEFDKWDSPLVLPEVERPLVNANQFRCLTLVQQPVRGCFSKHPRLKRTNTLLVRKAEMYLKSFRS